MTDADEPAIADEASYTVRRTIHVRATVDKVWAAVTRPEHLSRWFGETVLDGAGPGAEGSITFHDQGPIPLRVESVDEPRSVAYRWNNVGPAGRQLERLDPDRATVFTFTLEPVPEGTRLTVVETGFESTLDPHGNLEAHRVGWGVELDELVALLEGGS